MKKFIFKKQWGWLASGLSLGFIFLLAVGFVKPVGVSTQFVILDGVIWNSVSDELVKVDKEAKKGYSSTNTYLNKSGGKYAKSVANPINYSFIFVLAMVLGGFVASKLQTNKSIQEKNLENKLKKSPQVFRNQFGDDSLSKRYIVAFWGGVLVLFGARLAGGCTSGHMMSGMMQTSLSGYLFAAAAFAAAIPVAIIIYKKGA